MKKITIIFNLIAIINFTACNSSDKANTENNSEQSNPIKQNKDTLTTSTIANSNNTKTDTTAKFSTVEIINNYLGLKNALTKDDSKLAATTSKALNNVFNKINDVSFSGEAKLEYIMIAESAKENTKHIGDNAGKLEHQREHFALLSKDVADLIKAFGSSQKLYQDFCPMYDDGKGAIWISELKEIKNPYFGTKMISCGSMKKEY